MHAVTHHTLCQAYFATQALRTEGNPRRMHLIEILRTRRGLTIGCGNRTENNVKATSSVYHM